MKPEIIKICGLSTPEAVDAAIGGGATHIGMIFFEKSPRHLVLDKAFALSQHAGDRATKVAVTVDAVDKTLDDIVEASVPDMLQLHGSETIERVAELRERFGLPVIKVFAVTNVNDLEKAKPYIGIADHIMFDAKPPKGADLPGGNGVAFDWEIMDQWPQSVPYILSGGLDADNIEAAIESSGASGIDVSSGVESSPGIKDVELISKFLAHIA